MTRKKLLMLLGSICLALMMLVMACAGPAPTTPAPTTPAPTTPAPTTPAPTTPAPEEKVYEWRLQTIMPPTDPDWTIHLPRMRDWVTEISGGRLNITLYSPDTLVGTFEMFDAVAAGMIDMAHSCPSYWSGKLPQGLGDLAWCAPFSLERTEYFQYLCWETRWGEILKEEYAKLGVNLLGYGPWPPSTGSYGSFNCTRPVYTLDDLKGLKIRTLGYFEKMFAELGCETIKMPIGEAYTGLAMGTIDAVTFGGPRNHYLLKFHEVAPYWIEANPSHISHHDMFVNPDAFNALPDDLQAILSVAVRAFIFDTPPTWAYYDATYLQKMIEEGATVMHLSKDDRAVMKEVIWKYVEEDAAVAPETAEAVAILKDYMRLWGYLD